jgi:nitroimidazol reductase NimA-like FMN-containing flavoprotein (pyridoxamine 5'-phosphate oxidase superfamily)
MALQISKVEITPNPLQAGKGVEAICWITGDEPVSTVVAYLPNGESLYFSPQEEGKFILRETVPWEASPGVYEITLVARGKSGAVDRRYVSVTVA